MDFRTASADAGSTDGGELRVNSDELFFSTTDRRGVIRAGNSVFVRISGYREDELVGRPHNIVRHPQMPAGAYKLMWDRLLAGLPMAAYVRNRAKDGRTYWVFATVTPLGDGFLSVRMAPRSTLFGVAKDLYDQLLRHENQLHESGMRRADVAAAGAEELQRMVRAAGYSGYEEFMLQALPLEVSARGDLVSSLLRGHAQGPSHLDDVLAATGRLDGQLAGWVGRLDAYRDLAAVLAGASDSMLTAGAQLNRAVDAARRGSATINDRAPVLSATAEAMAVRSAAAVDTLRRLAIETANARALVAGLRFRIALARLHNDMAAAFAHEVATGRAPVNALAEVQELCDALLAGVRDMTSSMDEVNRKLETVNTVIHSAGTRLRDVAMFLGKLRGMVLRYQASSAMQEYVGPIDEQLNAGHHQLRGLDKLGERCLAEAVPFDGRRLAAQVESILTALAAA